jgi:hypothetical protein
MNPKKKKQRIPISNELDDGGWNLKKIMKNDWSQPLEFCNTYHEIESQNKSLTWKNNKVKFITN